MAHRYVFIGGWDHLSNLGAKSGVWKRGAQKLFIRGWDHFQQSRREKWHAKRRLLAAGITSSSAGEKMARKNVFTAGWDHFQSSGHEKWRAS